MLGYYKVLTKIVIVGLVWLLQGASSEAANQANDQVVCMTSGYRRIETNGKTFCAADAAIGKPIFVSTPRTSSRHGDSKI